MLTVDIVYNSEIRQWIEFVKSKREMPGDDYRAIWKMLNNDT